MQAFRGDDRRHCVPGLAVFHHDPGLQAPHPAISGTCIDSLTQSGAQTRFYQTEKAKILAADGWRIWPILWQVRRAFGDFCLSEAPERWKAKQKAMEEAADFRAEARPQEKERRGQREGREVPKKKPSRSLRFGAFAEPSRPKLSLSLRLQRPSARSSWRPEPKEVALECPKKGSGRGSLEASLGQFGAVAFSDFPSISEAGSGAREPLVRSCAVCRGLFASDPAPAAPAAPAAPLLECALPSRPRRA